MMSAAIRSCRPFRTLPAPRVQQLLFKRLNSVKYPPPPSHYDKPDSGPKSHTFRNAFILLLIGATVSYNYPIYPLIEKLYPLPDLNDNLAVNQYTSKLESQLQSLPIVSKLRDSPTYTESRGWNHLNLTPSGLSNFHGTLSTPGGIAIPPTSFHCQETGADTVIVHLGRRLSGFPFIVHGGITGMIIEETFKANLQREYPELHINDIHTHNLQLSYKYPTFVNQFVIIDSVINLAESNPNSGSYKIDCTLKSVKGDLLMTASAKLQTASFDTIPATTTKSKKWLW